MVWVALRTGLIAMGIGLIPLVMTSEAQLVDAPTTELTGRVVDPEGRPVTGAMLFYAIRAGDIYGLGATIEGVTGDDGRFHLRIPPVGANRDYVNAGTLWAYKPGALVSFEQVYRGRQPAGLPITLVVGPPAYTPIEVQDPDGNPVMGASVEPFGIHVPFSSAFLPRELSRRIAGETVTDLHGRATLKEILPEEIMGVHVTAPGYGRQRFLIGRHDRTRDVMVLTLAPTGRLQGRLIGAPALVRRRPIVLTASASNGSKKYTRIGIQTLTTDDEGRFEVPEIAVGKLGVSVYRDADSPFYFPRLGDVEIEPGRQSEIELTAQKAVRVSGLFVDRETKKPIPGVRIANFTQTSPTLAGNDGRFEVFTPPGPPMLLTTPPQGYAPLLYSAWAVQIPDVAEFVLPTAELSPSGEILGVVLDPAERPVVGAKVEVSWKEEKVRLPKYLMQTTVRSGLDGRFTVEGAARGVEVTLTASHRGLRIQQVVNAKFGSRGRVRLRLDDSRIAALDGRVVDPDGHPIPGVEVRLRRATSTIVPNTFTLAAEESVDFDGNVVLITDIDGAFHTPRYLDLDIYYTAYASSPGFVTCHTPWTAGGARSFGEITLPRE